MSDLDELIEEYDPYIEGKFSENLDESYDENSMEFCSPRFGELNYSEENSGGETDKGEDIHIYKEGDLQLYSDSEELIEDFNKDKEYLLTEIGKNNENNVIHNIQKSNNLISKYNKSIISQKKLINSDENNEPILETESEYNQPTIFKTNLNEEKKNNSQKNLNPTDQNEISYKELQLEVKSLLEASNKHQEEVHAELDGLLIENENYKEEISRLNTLLKNNELLLSKYKLNSLALNAQLPFLKSRSFMEEDKEELYFLRNKVRTIESKVRDYEKELEGANCLKEKILFLENELERITKEFNELEIFQTEQLRIADGEILSLTEAKNTLFKEMHLVMKENEGLKLTKSVISRIETHYKKINDETVLPNIEEELNDAIKDFMEDRNFNNNEASLLAFEICQSIIPRLAYEIAEEIVVNLDNGSKQDEKLKRSFIKKNASIQVGFPLLNGSTIEHSEIGIISSRSELISLRSENNKLKKENQKLKQDLFLMKRINNRTKDHAKIKCTNRMNPRQTDLITESQQEELVLSGIKWLTSVVNEIDELEQRCSSIKTCNKKSESRRSSAYNSTVASFEEINIDINDQQNRDEVSLDKELITLREKLINEGILVGE
ncbi:unnamed protein product [Cryptosporidium hominis]|uniref:Uncharacterized protein n=2 Tax=Cryptosporidium hominis TaxID=237895 RepID=A0A0S4TEF8_CRYHO|nr:hypothetical protein ChTU502y2012_408g0485 [Cryptosporidium hominis]PPA63114.1 hypothetical protein ChUKH1_11320 [Cryptosporidium hominis]PPS96214.1 Uncharacterized protein GY17_00001763 [Cryptosporidium hominis]CUV05701.1 unnamed protein product [Cryptosporidium hominis]|eukprot:PPS96214.1 Uncharacterized protein GY17_00001763 [Cryptosporidium hominis]